MILNASISLQNSLVSSFNLPIEHIKYCDKYFILQWQGRYLYTQLLGNKIIIKDRIPYHPIFLNNITMEWIARNPEEQIRVSFRKLLNHRAGYVLIAPSPRKTAISRPA